MNFSLKDSTGTSEDFMGLLKDFCTTSKYFSLKDPTGTSEDVLEGIPQLNVTTKWLNIP